MQNMHSGIGENIRQLRKRRGLSIGKLVDLVSIESGEAITDQYASAMERGERAVPTRLLVPVAKALHCTMSDLFGIAPPEADVHSHALDQRKLVAAKGSGGSEYVDTEYRRLKKNAKR